MLIFQFFFMRRFCAVVIYLLLSSTASLRAQTRLADSLKQAFVQGQDPVQRMNAVYQLADQAIDADTLLPYIIAAQKLVTNDKDDRDKDHLTYAWATYFARKNEIDSGLALLDPLIARYRNKQKDPAFYLRLLFFKAKTLDRGNQYASAISTLYNVIQVAETLKDTLTTIQARTGIGWVLMEMEQYADALQWLHKALHTSANPQLYRNYGALYSNIATSYNALGKSDSAISFINRAIADARENENLTYLATALTMQARIFVDNHQAALAEKPLNEALAIRKKLNDPFYIVYDMSSLASYYANNGQPAKGIALCMEGIEVAKKEKLSSQLMMIYRALAENYKKAGDMTLYSHTLEQIILLKDSFHAINSGKLLADLQANHEARKKEMLIGSQKLNLTKKNYWLVGSALFGVMAGIIVWLLFRNYRRRQQVRMQVALQEEKRLSVQAIAEAEEQERKRIAADLHDNLGVYAASMASNLTYIHPADSDTSEQEALRELRNNSNAIISELNDTIWVLKKNTLSLTAISDRLKVFINRIQKSYPGIYIEVEEQIVSDYQLPSSQAFHLYRILQEAINNALRHSRGRNIIIKFISNGNWKVLVEDDGAGMEPVTGGSRGNGLQHMKERCREAGWNIRWVSRELSGTAVEISPTTN